LLRFSELVWVRAGLGIAPALRCVISSNWLLACRAYAVRYSLPP
jgi:hypothetical protein